MGANRVKSKTALDGYNRFWDWSSIKNLIHKGKSLALSASIVFHWGFSMDLATTGRSFRRCIGRSCTSVQRGLRRWPASHGVCQRHAQKRRAHHGRWPPRQEYQQSGHARHHHQGIFSFQGPRTFRATINPQQWSVPKFTLTTIISESPTVPSGPSDEINPSPMRAHVIWKNENASRKLN